MTRPGGAAEYCATDASRHPRLRRRPIVQPYPAEAYVLVLWAKQPRLTFEIRETCRVGLEESDMRAASATLLASVD